MSRKPIDVAKLQGYATALKGGSQDECEYNEDSKNYTSWMEGFAEGEVETASSGKTDN